MKINRLLFLTMAVLFCAAVTSSATINHTWVSGAGSNTNPCTFTEPCATFARALTQTAEGGIVTVKDTGDFGPMTITQSVTIDGNLGSITSTGGNAITVNIGSSAAVSIRSLVINGGGVSNYGVYFTGTGTLTVDNCLIEHFIDAGIYFGSTGTEYGMIVNTSIRGVAIGVRTAPSSGNVLYDMVYIHNVSIVHATQAAVYSENGLMEIESSVMTQSDIGVELSDSAVMSVANSAIDTNTTGVCVGTGSKLHLDNDYIYDNPTAIANCGGTIKTSDTNKTNGTILIPPSDVSSTVIF